MKTLTPQKNNSSDDFQTPPEAILPLLKYLPKDWIVWECAAGKGNLVSQLNGGGYLVISTDKEFNFLSNVPKDKFDCIITNPPYSIKQQFLERAYSLGKPFAFLLPLTAFETQKRQALFKKHGLQVIFLNKRINFQHPSSTTGAWFATAWFTYGLNLPKDILFEEIR